VTNGRRAVRDLSIGIATGAGLIGLVFFASFGFIEAITLVATVVVLIWVSTVDPGRLVDDRGNPQLMLFGLGAVGVALMFTTATLVSTLTEYLALAVSATAFVVGLVRAIRFKLDRSPGR
jgi:hypothetical protein